MKINKVLAFDIGGTKIAYATVDRNGKILNEVIRHPTPAAPGAAAKLLKTIIAQFEDQIDAVAVSTAGTVDRTNSRITGSVGNMPEGYMDTDFKALSYHSQQHGWFQKSATNNPRLFSKIRQNKSRA